MNICRLESINCRLFSSKHLILFDLKKIFVERSGMIVQVFNQKLTFRNNIAKCIHCLSIYISTLRTLPQMINWNKNIPILHVHIYIHAYTELHICAYLDLRTHTPTHTLTHTHTHTHARTRIMKQLNRKTRTRLGLAQKYSEAILHYLRYVIILRNISNSVSEYLGNVPQENGRIMEGERKQERR